MLKENVHSTILHHRILLILQSNVRVREEVPKKMWNTKISPLDLIINDFLSLVVPTPQFSF